MKHKFSVRETDDLDHILEKYRLLAEESREAAESDAVPRSYRRAYRKMAQHWAELANELEEVLGTHQSVH